LRLTGYDYIQPLLTCDTAPLSNSPELSTVQHSIQKIIDGAKQEGSITEASVYLRDLVNRKEISIDPNATFYPASLKKLPLMMAYYKEAETHPGLLDEQVTITDPNDYNNGTTIKPKEFPVYGKTHTNMELLTFMIEYSDNTSFQVLLKNLGTEKFNQVYNDLQLHFTDNVASISDYMTPYQFASFFRTLFNATYLDRDSSEAALSLLSNSDYKNGLEAGIPDENIQVAHKFGIGVVTKPDGSQQGELHDCGIIYNQDHPYLLCVMTKSTSLDVTHVEKTIAAISSTVYDSAKNNFQPGS
jgi:beta-lactamase class A